VALLVMFSAALVAATSEFVRQRHAAGSRKLPVVTPLTSFSGLERNPAWSPDGRQIAYVRAIGRTGFDVYVQIVGAGEPLPLTQTPWLEMSPAWSPDGRYLAFLRATGDGKGLYVVPALGGPERKLSTFFGWNRNALLPQAVDWSPDGKTIVMVDKESEDEPWSLFSVSPNDGVRRRLTTPPREFLGDVRVAFSPDGQALAFVRARAGVADLYRLPMTGGDPVRLYSGTNFLLQGIAWTRDGKDILFSAGVLETKLWRLPADGGTAVPVNVGDNAHELSISRQGERLAYAAFS
jgi:Tol biopolymer transport system component